MARRRILAVDSKQHLMEIVQDISSSRKLNNTQSPLMSVDLALGVLWADPTGSGERELSLPLKRGDIWTAQELINQFNARSDANLAPSEVDVDKLFLLLSQEAMTGAVPAEGRFERSSAGT
jgi:hypothetical protein